MVRPFPICPALFSINITLKGDAMALDLLKEKGMPLSQQRFTWKELVQPPYSKLDDEAFTRIRVILMNGIQSESLRFSHVFARSVDHELRLALAQVRRVAHHQQTLVNWLNPANQNPLETTLGYEQVAIEVTASLALNEPDPYLAQTYRFGLLEDFDHLYRYAALYDRLTGKDANYLLQSYTDILPGRPLEIEHRHPLDDVRGSYDRTTAALVSKLNTYTLVAGEYQTHDYYMTVGPFFTDPAARQLYAEIASIEEQHVTQYESLTDANESWLERWLLHEANEAYNYYSCVESETNTQIKQIWERFLDYELGQLRFAIDIFENREQRDAAEVITSALPAPIEYKSHREFVRETLRQEVQLSSKGTEYVHRDQESDDTRRYRDHINSHGSPSQTVAEGYVWKPGTELMLTIDLPQSGITDTQVEEMRS
jgi:hypothetical protein